MQVWFLFLLVLVSLQLNADTIDEREQIQQRISPVGHVRVQDSNQSTAPASSILKTEGLVDTRKRSGQVTYEQHCLVCHRDGVAGAPKFRDVADWNPRLAKRNIDSLTLSALNGLNAMPVKGTCHECNEVDIKMAIEYMVPKS